jgi:hypothetical protein
VSVTIDSFVLLAPLLLLPIVLLLVFVGCGQALGLGEFHDVIPLLFSYEGDLPKDVQTLKWKFTIDVTVDPENGVGVIGDPPGGVDTGWFERNGNDIKPGGEDDIPSGFVDLRSYGQITCTCIVTKNAPPGELAPAPPLTKDKGEDEDAPRFKLVRAGTGFALK